MDLFHILFDDRYRSKVFLSNTCVHAYDFKVKVIDLQILIVIISIFGMMIDTGSEFYSMIPWPKPMT